MNIYCILYDYDYYYVLSREGVGARILTQKAKEERKKNESHRTHTLTLECKCYKVEDRCWGDEKKKSVTHIQKQK